MTDWSDGEVVRRVLSGDRDAFGVLVKRYQDQMLAYAKYMGFGDAEAYDIVQDGFVRAFRHLRRCGDPERFEGWLFKIVSNLCRTAGKRRSRRAMESLDDHRTTLVSAEESPHERVEARAVRQQLRSALDALPDDQREALVLMYLQGYSVREISDRTGASASAVKMRLKRGRDGLKERLESSSLEERS